MNDLKYKKIKEAVSEYQQPSTKNALLLFGVDLLIYLVAIVATFFIENPILKLCFAIVAGFKAATLFSISHDAAHNSFTGSRSMNQLIGRIAFLPVLHNYSLWLTVHNKLHHQIPNVKGENSWSPLSYQEYRTLPLWRKMVERLYRSPFGIGLNYTIERWWKHKFYPFRKTSGRYKKRCWFDFLLIVSYLGVYTTSLVYAGHALAYTTISEVIILSLILPIAIGHFMIGFTVYLQHTNKKIAWFKSKEEYDKNSYRQEQITMYVQFPRWYNSLSHNAMEHTVHHLAPRIPIYNLAKAQKKLFELLGHAMPIARFSLSYFLETMLACKLYDYENHRWLDFNGRPTSEINLYQMQEIAI